MATKKTRISKKREGAQIKDLKPRKNPKGGRALNYLAVRYPTVTSSS